MALTTERVFGRTYEANRKDAFVWKLVGPQGVIVFEAGPASSSSHEINLRYPTTCVFDSKGWSWTGWDIGYHSPIARHTGQTPIAESCDYLDGAPCYYDGSSLQANEILRKWFASGESDIVIEQELHEYYDAWLSSDGDVAANYITALSLIIKQDES